MRKRATTARPAPPTTPPLTAIPAGYAILPFGRGYWRPLLVVTAGVGLWAAPMYRELSRDGRTGAVCASQAEALAVIAEHQAWRKRQTEMARQIASQVARTERRERGKERA